MKRQLIDDEGYQKDGSNPVDEWIRESRASGELGGGHYRREKRRCEVIRQSEIEIIVSKCIEATILAVSQESDGRTLEAELQDVVRDELTKAGAAVQQKRRAIVTSPSAGQINVVRDYLPPNFDACESSGTIHGNVILIEGYDRAGWTLHQYVIPRLASGLIVAKEVKS